MSEQESFDKILESCLTMDTLKNLYPLENIVEEISISPLIAFERHKYLRWDLLEFVVAKIEKIIGRRLAGEEFLRVRDRIEKFLTDRKFYFKP